MIVSTMKKNASNVIDLFLDVIPRIAENDDICVQ